jgi:hypothetical protein
MRTSARNLWASSAIRRSLLGPRSNRISLTPGLTLATQRSDREKGLPMPKWRNSKDPLVDSAVLPKRKGTRPRTIRGPLHVQCSDHGDDKLLRQVVEEVLSWSDIKAVPSSLGDTDSLSLRIREDLAVEDARIFITGTEFGKVLFAMPTIHLTLPLPSAHWTIVQGWGEPHFSQTGYQLKLTTVGCRIVNHKHSIDFGKAVNRSVITRSHTSEAIQCVQTFTDSA